MCEAVEKYAKKYADKRVLFAKMASVNNLMENLKLSLDQALNALGIQGAERELIVQQLQK